MAESEQFHLTEISEWKDLPAEIAKIPADANLRMIVWSLPAGKNWAKAPEGAD